MRTLTWFHETHVLEINSACAKSSPLVGVESAPFCP
jgi:hypothetical protein